MATDKYEVNKDEPKEAPAVGQVQALGGTAIKPVGWDRTGWEAFRYMLYNPDTGEVLTRTPLSWLKITVFYCIYYSFLAGFWIGCLNIFFATLPDVEIGPKWKQDGSLIGSNPGVGLRPRNNDRDIDSQMFVLKANDINGNPSERFGEGTINADYASRLQEFFKLYDNKNMKKFTEPTGQYNEFDLSTLGPCGKYPYGYVKNYTGQDEAVQPCIVIKLNTIWGWEPTHYNLSRDGTPDSVIDNVGASKLTVGLDNVWIDCNGRYAADKEALEGGIEYYPVTRNLEKKYFPYLGKTKDEYGTVIESYHPPLVAIQIKPNVLGQLIHIECRAFYGGVEHVTKTKLGLVQFEVQITKN